MIQATTALLNKIATHEAGHALVAAVVGLRIQYVDLYESNTTVHISENRHKMQAYCMGGYAAQLVMGLHETSEVFHGSGDYSQGVADSAHTGFTNEMALEFAVGIVREHQHQLVRLRDKLLAQGFLSPADVSEVVYEHY